MDNCSFETGYRIEKDNGLGYAQMAELPVNTSTYSDNNAIWDSEQTYRVYAYTNANQSDYSNSINMNLAKVTAPSNLQLNSETLTEITLTWDDNCAFEEGFRVERSDDGGAWQQVAELPANTTGFTDTGLDNTITYGYRVYVYVTDKHTVYSNTVSGSPIEGVTDIDGNVYKTIKIGNQVWMAGNLKVTRYRNGDAIPNVTNNTQWTNLTTGAYCAYNNDNGNANNYGLLYNWYAVDDSRNIAPEGWHVPTDEEWKELEMHLGMSQSEADQTGWRGTDEGGKLKETGTTHWTSPNNGATNESGFTALPGGYRGDYDGTFFNMGDYGVWWSASEYSSAGAWGRLLYCSSSGVYRYDNYKQNGFSVRCVRD